MDGTISPLRFPTDSKDSCVASTDTLASSASPRRVLVVDDEPDCADTLGALLELSGFEVEIAYDGAAAVAAAARFEPHAVVCDLNMPGMDGFDVARTLRAAAFGRHCRLIALTAYGDAERRRRAAEAGFDHHVVKPANPTELFSLLSVG